MLIALFKIMIRNSRAERKRSQDQKKVSQFIDDSAFEAKDGEICEGSFKGLLKKVGSCSSFVESSIESASDSDSEKSNVSDLIDDSEVDPASDFRASRKLSQLIGKQRKGFEERTRRFLVRSPIGDLVDTEEESYHSESEGRGQITMADKDFLKRKEGDKQGDESREHNRANSSGIQIHVQHPLNNVCRLSDNERGIAVSSQDDRSQELSSKTPRQEDVGTDNTKMNNERASVTRAEERAMISPESRGAGSSKESHTLLENKEVDGMKITERLLGESGRQIALALMKEFSEKSSSKEGVVNPVNNNDQHSGAISMVKGYYPVLKPNVKIVNDGNRESKGTEDDDILRLSNGLLSKIEMINNCMVRGSGIDIDVVNLVLSCQRELCLEGVLDQANLMAAREHWRKFMSAAKEGKKNAIGDKFRDVMYCFFMQNCTAVNKLGEITIVTERDSNRTNNNYVENKRKASWEADSQNCGFDERRSNYTRVNNSDESHDLRSANKAFGRVNFENGENRKISSANNSGDVREMRRDFSMDDGKKFLF